MRRLGAILALVAVLSLGIPTHASAAPLGRCRMRLTEYPRAIRVGFVLLSSFPNRRWQLRILDDGIQVHREIHRADGRGDWRAGVWVRNRPGIRRYEGIATALRTGDRCRIALRA